MKLIKSLALLSFASLLIVACGKTKEETPVEEVVEEVVEAVEETPNIVGVASANGDFSTLVAAVTAAELVETLSGEGPFTVFAPTNAAFDKLPKGTVETLVKPENKGTLTTVLTYHVVAGKYNAKDIAKLIKAGNGKAELKTVQGGILTASMEGKKLVLTDAKGGKSYVTIADVNQSNGVIHVIDTVVMP